MNKQKPEKRVQLMQMGNALGNIKLDVHSIWYTIQGEGPFAGIPATFVRLAGCNLQCPGCDTDYTSKRQLLTIPEIESLIIKSIPITSKKATHLVVLTGGEPFRQPISYLLSARVLENHPIQYQVETNGTLVDDAYCADHSFGAVIVVSPKTPAICKAMEDSAHFFKYILDHRHIDPKDGLPSDSLGMGMAYPPYRPDKLEPESIFLNPMDTGNADDNKRNVDAVVASCLKHGYRLGLQIHKLVGLD